MLPMLNLAVGAFSLVVVEAAVSSAFRTGWYGLRDTLANLAMAAGGFVVGVPGRALATALSFALYEYRMFDLPEAAWVWALLLVAEDLCYYCFHRTSHTVALFWAAHVPHHSSTKFNLSTALRASWTTPFTGIVFWLPLPLLGFHPLWILSVHAVSLSYQFFLHTAAVGRLGPLEWIVNTPSHHRVHHARNPEYLDRNFGGMLIIWDRMFGTFAEERQQPTYGTVKALRSHHPFVIAFSGWAEIAKRVLAPGLSWADRGGIAFGRPAAERRCNGAWPSGHR